MRVKHSYEGKRKAFFGLGGAKRKGEKENYIFMVPAFVFHGNPESFRDYVANLSSSGYNCISSCAAGL
jgi:hypothetical protein